MKKWAAFRERAMQKFELSWSLVSLNAYKGFTLLPQFENVEPFYCLHRYKPITRVLDIPHVTLLYKRYIESKVSLDPEDLVFMLDDFVLLQYRMMEGSVEYEIRNYRGP